MKLQPTYYSQWWRSTNKCGLFKTSSTNVFLPSPVTSLCFVSHSVACELIGFLVCQGQGMDGKVIKSCWVNLIKKQSYQRMHRICQGAKCQLEMICGPRQRELRTTQVVFVGIVSLSRKGEMAQQIGNRMELWVKGHLRRAILCSSPRHTPLPGVHNILAIPFHNPRWIVIWTSPKQKSTHQIEQLQ